jgi:tetratricopeptide (TPR) repeat protein
MPVSDLLIIGEKYGLALLYYAQGKYAAAEPLYQRALKIRQEALGPEHPSTIIVLNNYAALLRAMGREHEAAALGRA